MSKIFFATITFLASTTLATIATADVQPGPSCKCEVPGASSAESTPLSKGVAAMVCVMGLTVVLRRKREGRRG